MFFITSFDQDAKNTSSAKDLKGKTGKDLAYWERNQLVAHLSKIYPSWLEKHPAEDTSWEAEWRNIVLVETPGGQCSWHVHDSEMGDFQHLAFREGNRWDGHSMEEKYQRLKKGI